MNVRCSQIRQYNDLVFSRYGNSEVPLYTRCRQRLSSCVMKWLFNFVTIFSGYLCDDGDANHACVFTVGFGSQCLSGFTNTPLTTSFDRMCTIPCAADSDCLSGKCRVRSKWIISLMLLELWRF